MAKGDDNFDEVMEWLWSFDYSGFPSGPLKIGVQTGVVVTLIVLLKALDGETCGLGWKWYFPQTWGNPVGCFARGLVRGVPTPSFDWNSTEKDKEEGGTIISPPNSSPNPSN